MVTGSGTAPGPLTRVNVSTVDSSPAPAVVSTWPVTTRFVRRSKFATSTASAFGRTATSPAGGSNVRPRLDGVTRYRLARSNPVWLYAPAPSVVTAGGTGPLPEVRAKRMVTPASTAPPAVLTRPAVENTLDEPVSSLLTTGWIGTLGGLNAKPDLVGTALYRLPVWNPRCRHVPSAPVVTAAGTGTSVRPAMRTNVIVTPAIPGGLPAGRRGAG